MADNVCERGSDTSASKTGPFKVCQASRIPQTGRLHISVHSRSIIIYNHMGTYYGLDSRCYHSGGPLEDGQIEELPTVGHSCIVCPWHKYKISLITGEGFFKAVDINNPQVPSCWKSKGVKQRTHKVYEKDGEVFIELSDLEDKRESDYYYSAEYRKIMSNVKLKR